MDYRTAFGVFAGGFLGAAARYLLTAGITIGSVFPMTLTLVNLTGAFVLSLFMAFSLERLRLPGAVRTAVSTGFIGAFTTFSGLCAEGTALTASSGWMTGAGYYGLSLFGGLGASLLGLAAARAAAGLTGRPRA